VVRSVRIIDTVPPVITLVGNVSLTYESAVNWTDPGYSAYDTLDGNITNRVVITGSVNVMAVSGSVFTLLYNVRDTAGNNAVERQRVVTMRDTIPPVITLRDSNVVEHEAATRPARPGCADVGSGHCLHELLCRGRYIRRVEDEHIHYARTQGAQQVHLHRHDASPVGGTGGRGCAVRVTIDVAREQRRVGKQAAEVGDHAPTARTYLDTQSGAAT
jgi:hypothetical protein